MTMPVNANRPPLVGSLILVLAVSAVVLAVVRMRQGDAQFAQRTLNGLIQGRVSVQRALDWEHLAALDMDVGQTYRGLPEGERTPYRRSFITGFAQGFQNSGANTTSFTHWRIHERGAQTVIIAADYPAKQKIMLMTLSTTGPKRVQAIQWQ